MGTVPQPPAAATSPECLKVRKREMTMADRPNLAGEGPRHVHVVGEDGVLVRAARTGDIGPDGETVNPAGLRRIQARIAANRAALRTAEINELAGLIREVDGDHTLGAAELAEALIDRGVSFRSSW